MNFTSLDIPDDDDALAAWLERQLVGLELGNVVAGLRAFADRSLTQRTLADWLGQDHAHVLSRGLTALPRERLRELFQSPRLLLELQELVLSQGGDYWRTVPRDAAHERLVGESWKSIATKVEPAATASVAQPERTPHSRRAWLLSSAAALLVGAFAGWQVITRRVTPPDWGFDQSGLLTADIPPAEYLQRLANAASQWFNRRPEDAADLRQRIQEFRHGCDTLQAASHPQLAAADREWLLERCRVWAGKLDGHLRDLNSGKDVSTVRSEADDTINKLMAALRERATMVA